MFFCFIPNQSLEIALRLMSLLAPPRCYASVSFVAERSLIEKAVLSMRKSRLFYQKKPFFLIEKAVLSQGTFS